MSNGASRGGTLFAVSLAIMFLIAPMASNGLTVMIKFEGDQDSVTVPITEDGSLTITNITLPDGIEVLNATMKIEGSHHIQSWQASYDAQTIVAAASSYINLTLPAPDELTLDSESRWWNRSGPTDLSSGTFENVTFDTTGVHLNTSDRTVLQNSEKTVPTSSVFQSEYCIELEVDSQNTAHILYSKPGFKVYYLNTTDGGQTFSNEILMSKDVGVGIEQWEPSMFIDENEGIHVVFGFWSSSEGNTIHYQRSTDRGDTWLISDIIIDTGANRNDPGDPDLVVDSQGTVHVVWTDNRPSFGNMELLYSKMTSGSGSFDPPKFINTSGISGGMLQFWPRLAVGSDDVVHLIWMDDRTGDYRVNYITSDDGGDNWSGVVEIQDFPGNVAQMADIALDGNDTVHIVWEEDGGATGQDVRYSKKDSGGFGFYGYKSLSKILNNVQATPRIKIGNDSTIHVVWEDGRNNGKGRDIYHRSSTNGGDLFLEESIINTDGSSRDQGWPRIALGPNDQQHFLWLDDSVPVTVKYRSGFIPYKDEGTIVSSVLDLGGPKAKMEILEAVRKEPIGTEVAFTVFSSQDGTTWDQGTQVDPGTSDPPVPTGRYYKWKADLLTQDNRTTPHLDSVSMFLDNLYLEGTVTVPIIGYPDGEIARVLTRWNGTVPGGNSSIRIEATVNGSDYFELSKDVWALPPAPGNDLGFRITMTSDGSERPILNDLEIEIEIVPTYIEEVELRFDDIAVWVHSGRFSNNETIDITDQLRSYMSGAQPDTDGLINVPVTIQSVGMGHVEVSDLLIEYTYIPGIPTLIGPNDGHLSSGSILEFQVSSFQLDADEQLSYDIEIVDEMGKTLILARSTIDTDAFDAAFYDNNSTATFTLDVKENVPNGTYRWRARAADEHVNGPWSHYRNLTVDISGGGPGPDPSNKAPVITSTPTTEIAKDAQYSYLVRAIDEDGDDLTYGLSIRPTGMTIDGDNLLQWTPTGVGMFEVLIWVSDGQVKTLQGFNITVSFNVRPEVKAINDFEIEAGDLFKYNIQVSDADGDDLKFTLDTGPPGLVVGGNGQIIWKTGDKDQGKHHVVVFIDDGHGHNISEEFDIKVTPRASMISIFEGPLLILVIIITAVVIVGIAIYATRSRKVHPVSGDGTEQTEEQGVGDATDVTGAPPPPDEGETPLVDPFDVEEVFLIYKDGRLINRRATKKTEVDDEILSSMLVAIRDFVKDSFRTESGLDSFEFSGRKVLLQPGSYTILAVGLSGAEPPMLRDEMITATSKVEGMYSGVIEDWDGDLKAFEGVDRFLDPFFLLRSKVRFIKKVDVRVKSAIELYRGYIRMKVGIINNMDTTITEASLRMRYDRKALILSHVEPDYPLEGPVIDIGTVYPKEKKAVALYLDPMICTESHIDGTFSYLDFKGDLKHIDMKRRTADIVCPIFYTPQTINIAMLQRLAGEVKYKDIKGYRVPEGVSPTLAFELTKEAVLRHDVKFVREYMEGEEGDPADPLKVEAWFYAKVKVTDEQMCIKIHVREKDRTIRVFVGSDNLATVGGLLADLGHDMTDAFRKVKVSSGLERVDIDLEED